MTVTGTAQRRFNVRDGQRPLTFEGWCLAEADTQNGDDVRWTELAMYRTVTGRYVIEKIGRSDVYHSDDCARRRKGDRHDSLVAGATANDKNVDECVPCTECGPSDDDGPVWMEKDFFTSTMFASVEEAIRSLYRDDNGIPRLSHVAQTLLGRASESDPAVLAIMRTPVDVT